MLLLGQLLDVLDDNERVIIRSSTERSLTFIEEVLLSQAKPRLTRDARKCSVACIYSDNSEHAKGETVTVIYIRPNGCFVTLE